MQPTINGHIAKIGFTSDTVSFLIKYKWIMVFVSFAAFELVLLAVDQNPGKLERSFFALISLYLVIVTLGNFLLHGRCYKIEVDTNSKVIILYLIYNKVISCNAEHLRVVVGAYCTICAGDAKYTIDAAFIHDLVSYLPKETIVEYKGRMGRYTEKEWDKQGRPLVPGSRL